LGCKSPRSIFFWRKNEFNTSIRSKKNMFACEAGAGSSLMVKNGLIKKAKKAGLRCRNSSCTSNSDSK